MLLIGLALALIALAVAAVGVTGRRERDRFIEELEAVRSETLLDRGDWNAMR
jgi:hypothetical protein